ncbi:MAG TPA: PD-(D/E)XK nuclease family protein [Actinomycetes bacterium]|nr:PD-(D/E)XK nuclease family protein [Actinomycetes bacterium]
MPSETARPEVSLSPSRAGDFMSCPLLYRFRVIDRLPEPPSPAATRGTLVHAVLEQLFDLPAPGRTLEAAQSLVPAAWATLLAEDEELGKHFADDDGTLADEWLQGTEDLLGTYFALEDPRRLEPSDRELEISVTLADGLVLRGIVDRLDVTPDGAMRVVDYKTGKSPRVDFEQKAMFQMRFYALALWRARGTVPRLLQLMYLTDGLIMRYEPDERDLLAMERKLSALAAAISRAVSSGQWRPSPSKLCDWCAHRDLCPAWGGTPPPLPEREVSLHPPELA